MFPHRCLADRAGDVLHSSAVSLVFVCLPFASSAKEDGAFIQPSDSERFYIKITNSEGHADLCEYFSVILFLSLRGRSLLTMLYVAQHNSISHYVANDFTSVPVSILESK